MGAWVEILGAIIELALVEYPIEVALLPYRDAPWYPSLGVEALRCLPPSQVHAPNTIAHFKGILWHIRVFGSVIATRRGIINGIFKISYDRIRCRSYGSILGFY